MLRAPKFCYQYFTYENSRAGDPNPISTAILQDSADASIKALGPDLTAMGAAKPYSNFGTEYPSYGTQSAISSLSNLPANIINDRSAAIQLQNAAAQLPVNQQKAATELQEQQLAQNRLKGLLNPGLDANGKPNPNISSNVTSINGTNVAVGPTPIPFGGGTSPVTVQPVQPTTPAPQPQPTQTTQPSTQPQTSQTTTLPPAPMAPSVTKPILSHALFGTPLPSLSSSDPSTQNTQASTNVASTNSPVPLDATANTRTHLTPQEMSDWYSQNVSNNVAGARQEFDPQTGQATNRIIISHKAVNGQTMPDQPVHSAYALSNLGSYVPPPVGTNAALASNPAAAITSPASYGTSQQIQQNLNAGIQLPSAPAIPYQSLETGTLSPQQLLANSGPLMASNSSAALPSAPGMSVPWRPGIADAAFATPTPQATPVPQATSAPRATIVGANPGATSHPAVTVAQDDDFWRKNYGGMTGAQVGQAFQDPKNVSIVGPSETIPLTGAPSQKALITINGQQYPGYVDADGNPYAVRGRTDYHETRINPLGVTYDVDNKIGEAEDMDMMKASMAAGTVSGNWQSLPRGAKIAAYRQAQALTDYPVNEDATKRVLALENVQDTGNRFLNLVQKSATPQDPTALAIRNGAHQQWSDNANYWGPYVNDLTRGQINPGQGDPRVNQLKNAYQEFTNAAMSSRATDMPARGLTADKASAQADVGDFGAFTDPQLPSQIQNFMANRGVDLNKQVDAMIANHNRLPVSAVYKANLMSHPNDAPGANFQTPFHGVNSRAAYDRIPGGAWYQTDGYNPIQKDPAFSR